MLYIFGSGGGTFELLESKEFLGCPVAFKKITCIEENPSRQFFDEDIPIISLEEFNSINFDDVDSLLDMFFISASDVFFKQRIDNSYPNIRWKNFVHSKSDCLLKDLGQGNWFGYGVHVGSEVVLGKHIRLNVGACVSGGNHGNTIGDYSFIGINASVLGGVKIGKGVFVGSGATILNKHITIGDFAVIGAGAVVTKDVPEGATVMGVPARIVSENKIEQLELI